ncbi:MAG: lipopolysaccharide kinase InaA family protein [Candidatus Bathyarchaeia archaeon]
MDETLVANISGLMRKVASGQGLVASMIYGSRVAGYARKDSLYDCMVILKNYPYGVRYCLNWIGNMGVSTLQIDDELFSLDVSQGVLGEFIAGRLLFPNIFLDGARYLREKEVEFKERVVREELEGLICQLGEASRGLVIKTEYFALSRILRRSRTYPPLRYSYLNTFKPSLRDRNMARILPGYRAAIDKLIDQGILSKVNGGVSVSDSFIDRVLARKTIDKIVDVVAESKRAISSYLVHGIASLSSLEDMSREVASKLRRELLTLGSNIQAENPQKYIYLKTSYGLVQIDERGSILDIVGRVRPNSKAVVTPIGGVLNEVYLAIVNGERLVVKKYTDWHGFKWFTLNLVTLGTKTFAVSGRARLSNEFGINHLLRRSGINVPEIIFISLPDKMLVSRYVEGQVAIEIIKQIFKGRGCQKSSYEDVENIGRSIGKIHSLGIQIGDSKPENFIRDHEGRIFIIDLEQARRGDDLAWDIAEFLYYSAHYATKPTSSINCFVESFINGYLDEGGDKSSLKRAAGISYLRVFSLWALPQVNYMVAEVLRKHT